MAEDGETKPEESVGTNSVLQDAVTAFMAGEADLREVRVALETSWGPSTTSILSLRLVPCVVGNSEAWKRCQQLHDAPFAAALFRRLLVGASSLKAWKHVCAWHPFCGVSITHVCDPCPCWVMFSFVK